MATPVKFLKKDDEVFAYFPFFNYNKPLYGTDMKQSYSSIGQHSGCSKEYANEAEIASKEEYQPLLDELISIGYNNLKVLNK